MKTYGEQVCFGFAIFIWISEWWSI